MKHEQFTSRNKAKEFYVVADLNKWSKVHTNSYGGWSPDYNDGDSVPGHLWPSYDKAVAAAKHVLKTHPGKVFGIFKVVAIVEQATSPTRVTRVSR